MPAYNHVVMLGNLTRDPQLSYTPNQTAVVDFGLGINRKWRASDGSTREEVCFIDVRAFAGLAENINKYLKKGRLLLVDGHLAFDTWTAQDGTKKSKHRLIAENAQFMPTANPQGSGQGNGGPEPDDIPI